MLLGEEWGGEVLLIGRSGWRCHVTFKKNWAEHLRPREWQEVERACASARRVGSSQGGPSPERQGLGDSVLEPVFQLLFPYPVSSVGGLFLAIWTCLWLVT